MINSQRKQLYTPNHYTPKKSYYAQSKIYKQQRKNSRQNSYSNSYTQPTNKYSQKTNEIQSQNSKVYDHQSSNNILCLNWNTKGNTLCSTSYNQIKIWSLYPQSGLKCNIKKQIYDFDIIDVRYANQNIFGVLSLQIVKFYDTRQGIFRGIFQLKSQNNQQYNLFDISQTTNYFTIGDYFTFKNYDYRYIKNKSQNKFVNQFYTQIPMYDIKWSQFNTPVLISGGGSDNHGIVTLHNPNLQKLIQLQLHTSQIISLSFDTQFNKILTLSAENTLQISQLPQILCQSIISLPQQYNLLGCHINWNGEWIAILQAHQVMIYNSNRTQQAQEIVKISNNSAVSWHPNKNILAYISQKQKMTPTLLKLKQNTHKKVQNF